MAYYQIQDTRFQNIFYLIVLCTAMTCTGCGGQQSNSAAATPIIAEGATLQKMAGEFSFTEGPAANAKGEVFFTDQPNNKIWKYDNDGKLTLFMHNAGRSNGMYFRQNGNLVTCADEHNQLWEITPSGNKTVLLDNLNGKHFNGPNDVWIHPSGNIYFTDPYYQRDYWSRTKADIQKQNLYFFAGGKAPVALDTSLNKPNGLIGTANGKLLYVADIGAGKTYRYIIGKDGSLTDKTLFVSKGSDGMTIDNRGNIYLTGDGVTVFDPSGKQIEHINVPGAWTANVCFGGARHNQLFITASKAVYTLQMNVKAAD